MKISGLIVKGDIESWVFRESINESNYSIFAYDNYVTIIGQTANILEYNIKNLINNSDKVARFHLDEIAGDFLFDLIEERELIKHILHVNFELVEDFGIELNPSLLSKNATQLFDNLIRFYFDISANELELKNNGFKIKRTQSKLGIKSTSFFDLYPYLMAPKAIVIFIVSPYLLYILINLIINSNNINDIGLLIYPLVIISLPLLILIFGLKRILTQKYELNKYVYKNKTLEYLTLPNNVYNS